MIHKKQQNIVNNLVDIIMSSNPTFLINEKEFFWLNPNFPAIHPILYLSIWLDGVRYFMKFTEDIVSDKFLNEEESFYFDPEVEADFLIKKREATTRAIKSDLKFFEALVRNCAKENLKLQKHKGESYKVIEITDDMLNSKDYRI